jgi:hypothetical protein
LRWATVEHQGKVIEAVLFPLGSALVICSAVESGRRTGLNLTMAKER